MTRYANHAAISAAGESPEPQRHDVHWSGCFRGTDSDPRETGWCQQCQREVYDGESGHTTIPDAPMETTE